ncbi:hypothetical protein ACFXOD_36965 [Streptomyces sp. NPDC059161]|uniref:hypothetical protein n=1 Tax=Streptomyces sp. NPDC059161 TaxID=3346749 RepID=UPI00369B2A6A
MTTFLAALGTKLADRWITLLILPGLLYVGVTTAATQVLSQGRWNDSALLHERIDEVASSPTAHSPGSILLVTAAVLIVSVGVGLLAECIGRFTEWWWMGAWAPGIVQPAQVLVRWRRRRWTDAAERHRAALRAKALHQLDPQIPPGGADSSSNPVPVPDTEALNSARNRIALVEPRRPTWMGDRMLAVAIRVRDRYDLDLASAWPRLWLIVPEETRTQLASARTDLASAARLAGWGALYLPLALWWWPAALIAAASVAVAWWLGRYRTDRLADLIEATVDVHGRALAASLGIECPGALTPQAGEAITRALRKGA